MVRREAVFGCGDGMTPDIAAKIAQMAERYDADLQLECDGKRVRLDSLIGILSVACRRGTPLSVLADGADEVSAAQAVAAALQGA